MEQNSDITYKHCDTLSKNLIWSLLAVVAALSSLEVAARAVGVTYENPNEKICVQQLVVQLSKFDQNNQNKHIIVHSDYCSIVSFEYAKRKCCNPTSYNIDYVTPTLTPSLRIRAPNV